MEQVIINILLNSIEAIQDHGEIIVTTKIEKDKQKMILIEIADNGPGIDKNCLPYIFDPFFSEKIKGTGIGLTNVKKIIDLHRGEVKAYPRMPKGIEFQIKIPFE
jgi:signal transduction histidine kinase